MNAPVKVEVQEDDAFRAAHVGASEVAALFDCHQWLTRFELWNVKAGKVPPQPFNVIADDGAPLNERAYWGVRLEREIIEAAKERWGYRERDQVDRLSNGRGLGGHPDRRVICPVRGPGILETKMVDWLEHKKWGGEPPLPYLLQNQTYQGLDAVEWGDIIVLVGGNALVRYQYQHRPVLYADIEARAEEFWRTVREDRPPKPEYSRDRAVLGELYADAADVVTDFRLDNRMTHLACEYVEAAEAKRAADARVDALQAELLDKLGDSTVALVDGYRVRVPVIAGSPDTVITSAMVGKTVKGRSPHRRFYIKEIE